MESPRQKLHEDELSPFLADALPGPSAVIRRVRRQIEGIARLGHPVLLTGEIGSGRAHTASLLHAIGPSPGAPFVNTPHEEGPGRTPTPVAGTLFLDDLEEMRREDQRRWGAALESARLSCRLIASAGPEFVTHVKDGKFDPNFGNALLRFEVSLPPLRKRIGDLGALVASLLSEIGEDLGRTPHGTTPEANATLEAHPWHGNLGELRRVMDRLVAFSVRPVITGDDVRAVLDDLRPSIADMRERQRNEEREDLIQVLANTGGNVTRTAEILGRSRAAVYRMVRRHGVALRARG